MSPQNLAYGVLMAVAYILAGLLYNFNKNKSSNSLPSTVDILLILAVSGIIGARLAYVISFHQDFKSLKEILAIHQGGLIFYGGFLLSILALFLFYGKSFSRFLQITDNLSPSLCLGHAIGRIGCFFSGCCYGIPTESIQLFKLSYETCYRHPTQLYESGFLIFLGLYQQKKLKQQAKDSQSNPGSIAFSHIIMYSIFRFLIEFIRGDQRGEFFTALNLSQGQIISILCILIVFILKKLN